jgi:hypothetical protein
MLIRIANSTLCIFRRKKILENFAFLSPRNLKKIAEKKKPKCLAGSFHGHEIH